MGQKRPGQTATRRRQGGIASGARPNDVACTCIRKKGEGENERDERREGSVVLVSYVYVYVQDRVCTVSTTLEPIGFSPTSNPLVCACVLIGPN